MKKKDYLMPVTEIIRINLEEAFLGASNERYSIGNEFVGEFEDDEEDY